MRLFTYMDHLAGVCSPAEIGAPWQPRWSKSDFTLGVCSESEVGTVRPPQQSADDKPFVALTKAERRRLTQELSDKLLIMAHENPAAFMDDAGPQINKFLDAASKLDDADENTGLPFTKEQIAKMPRDELRFMIVKMIHELPPEKRIKAILAGQVADALMPFIPAERRDEAMQVLAALPEPS